MKSKIYKGDLLRGNIVQGFSTGNEMFIPDFKGLFYLHVMRFWLNEYYLSSDIAYFSLN